MFFSFAFLFKNKNKSTFPSVDETIRDVKILKSHANDNSSFSSAEKQVRGVGGGREKSIGRQRNHLSSRLFAKSCGGGWRELSEPQERRRSAEGAGDATAWQGMNEGEIGALKGFLNQARARLPIEAIQFSS